MTQSASKKGTWLQAIVSFLLPLLIILTVRWAFLEPFVIPSGSMIPTLLVNDHILVQKFQYGLKWPFGSEWMIRWNKPKRGEVVVFKYPENPKVYYIKRLIGLPGDQISVQSGFLTINGQKVETQSSDVAGDRGYFYFNENLDGVRHLVRFYEPEPGGDTQIFIVPTGKYFFMGDNRDESNDSRAWGFVDENLLVGKASVIWFSCVNKLPTMSFLCDPSQMRWERTFQSVN